MLDLPSSLPPPRQLSKLRRFVKTPWEVSGISRSEMPECVRACVRAYLAVHVCMHRRQQVEELSFLHVLVDASAFKDWAPRALHTKQPARRNEIPIIFN